MERGLFGLEGSTPGSHRFIEAGGSTVWNWSNSRNCGRHSEFNQRKYIFWIRFEAIRTTLKLLSPMGRVFAKASNSVAGQGCCSCGDRCPENSESDRWGSWSTSSQSTSLVSSRWFSVQLLVAWPFTESLWLAYQWNVVTHVPAHLEKSKSKSKILEPIVFFVF